MAHRYNQQNYKRKGGIGIIRGAHGIVCALPALFSLFIFHHLGLKLRRREGFLPRLYSEAHATKLGRKFLIALCCGQSRLGALARFLVVVIIITLVEQHKCYVVLGVDKPIPKPRPQTIIPVYGLYLFVIGSLREQTVYLLSSFVFVASSAACASAAFHLFSVSLTPSPIGFIERAS